MKRIAASFYAALAGAALFAAEPAQDTLIAHRGESQGSRRYDKENLLWQSTVAIRSDPNAANLRLI